MQGLEMPNIYTIQGIEHIKFILQHGGQNTQNGRYLQCIIEGHHLETGSLYPLLELSYKKYNCLVTYSLIKQMWEFNDKFGLKIETTVKTPTPLRKNDKSIMDSIISSSRYTTEDLHNINKCRKWLRVITTADITTGCGRYIKAEYIKKPNKRPRKSKYNWPYQPIPSKKIWATWKKAITSVLCKDTTYQLHTKLGAWIQKSHQNFEYFVNPNDSKLYKKVKDTWKMYIPFNNSRRWAHTFDNDPTPTNEPENIVPTTIEHTSTLLICAHIPASENTTPTPQHITNSHPMFNEAPAFVQKMMIQVNIPTQRTHLINAFYSGIAVCVTDGSYDPFIDTAAVCWLIEGKNGIGRCKGFDRVYGDKRFMDPYRSKLHKIYCILLFVKYFCKYFDIKNGTIKVVCDCKGALHSALKWDERATTTCKHYDLIWSIYDLRKEITVQIIPEHVYGHQDDLRKTLTRLEQLNCKTDLGAKRFLQYCQDNNIKAQGKPYGSQWKLSIDNVLINQKIDTQIISAVHGKRLRKFLIEKGRSASETFDLIN